MTKNELIDEYHATLKRKKLSIRRSDSKELFDLAIDCIFDNVTKGRQLTISDFGTFKSTLRLFHNLSKSGKDEIETWVIKFMPSLKMKAKINERQNIGRKP